MITSVLPPLCTGGEETPEETTLSADGTQLVVRGGAPSAAAAACWESVSV